MSADYYGHLAGEIADSGGNGYEPGDDWYDGDPYEPEPPPDWYDDDRVAEI